MSKLNEELDQENGLDDDVINLCRKPKRENSVTMSNFQQPTSSKIPTLSDEMRLIDIKLQLMSCENLNPNLNSGNREQFLESLLMLAMQKANCSSVSELLSDEKLKPKQPKIPFSYGRTQPKTVPVQKIRQRSLSVSDPSEYAKYKQPLLSLNTLAFSVNEACRGGEKENPDEPNISEEIYYYEDLCQDKSLLMSGNFTQNIMKPILRNTQNITHFDIEKLEFEDSSNIVNLDQLEFSENNFIVIPSQHAKQDVEVSENSYKADDEIMNHKKDVKDIKSEDSSDSQNSSSNVTRKKQRTKFKPNLNARRSQTEVPDASKKAGNISDFENFYAKNFKPEQDDPATASFDSFEKDESCAKDQADLRNAEVFLHPDVSGIDSSEEEFSFDCIVLNPNIEINSSAENLETSTDSVNMNSSSATNHPQTFQSDNTIEEFGATGSSNQTVVTNSGNFDSTRYHKPKYQENLNNRILTGQSSKTDQYSELAKTVLKHVSSKTEISERGIIDESAGEGTSNSMMPTQEEKVHIIEVQMLSDRDIETLWNNEFYVLPEIDGDSEVKYSFGESDVIEEITNTSIAPNQIQLCEQIFCGNCGMAVLQKNWEEHLPLFGYRCWIAGVEDPVLDDSLLQHLEYVKMTFNLQKFKCLKCLGQFEAAEDFMAHSASNCAVSKNLNDVRYSDGSSLEDHNSTAPEGFAHLSSNHAASEDQNDAFSDFRGFDQNSIDGTEKLFQIKSESLQPSDEEIAEHKISSNDLIPGQMNEDNQVIIPLIESDKEIDQIESTVEAIESNLSNQSLQPEIETKTVDRKSDAQQNAETSLNQTGGFESVFLNESLLDGVNFSNISEIDYYLSLDNISIEPFSQSDVDKISTVNHGTSFQDHGTEIHIVKENLENIENSTSISEKYVEESMISPKINATPPLAADALTTFPTGTQQNLATDTQDSPQIEKETSSFVDIGKEISENDVDFGKVTKIESPLTRKSRRPSNRAVDPVLEGQSLQDLCSFTTARTRAARNSIENTAISSKQSRLKKFKTCEVINEGVERSVENVDAKDLLAENQQKNIAPLKQFKLPNLLKRSRTLSMIENPQQKENIDVPVAKKAPENINVFEEAAINLENKSSNVLEAVTVTAIKSQNLEEFQQNLLITSDEVQNLFEEDSKGATQGIATPPTKVFQNLDKDSGDSQEITTTFAEDFQNLDEVPQNLVTISSEIPQNYINKGLKSLQEVTIEVSESPDMLDTAETLENPIATISELTQNPIVLTDEVPQEPKMADTDDNSNELISKLPKFAFAEENESHKDPVEDESVNANINLDLEESKYSIEQVEYQQKAKKRKKPRKSVYGRKRARKTINPENETSSSTSLELKLDEAQEKSNSDAITAAETPQSTVIFEANDSCDELISEVPKIDFVEEKEGPNTLVTPETLENPNAPVSELTQNPVVLIDDVQQVSEMAATDDNSNELISELPKIAFVEENEIHKDPVEEESVNANINLDLGESKLTIEQVEYQQNAKKRKKPRKSVYGRKRARKTINPANETSSSTSLELKLDEAQEKSTEKLQETDDKSFKAQIDEGALYFTNNKGEYKKILQKIPSKLDTNSSNPDYVTSDSSKITAQLTKITESVEENRKDEIPESHSQLAPKESTKVILTNLIEEDPEEKDSQVIQALPEDASKQREFRRKRKKSSYFPNANQFFNNVTKREQPTKESRKRKIDITETPHHSKKLKPTKKKLVFPENVGDSKNEEEDTIVLVNTKSMKLADGKKKEVPKAARANSKLNDSSSVDTLPKPLIKSPEKFQRILRIRKLSVAIPIRKTPGRNLRRSTRQTTKLSNEQSESSKATAENTHHFLEASPEHHHRVETTKQNLLTTPTKCSGQYTKTKRTEMKALLKTPKKETPSIIEEIEKQFAFRGDVQVIQSTEVSDSIEFNENPETNNGIFNTSQDQLKASETVMTTPKKINLSEKIEIKKQFVFQKENRVDPGSASKLLNTSENSNFVDNLLENLESFQSNQKILKKPSKHRKSGRVTPTNLENFPFTINVTPKIALRRKRKKSSYFPTDSELISKLRRNSFIASSTRSGYSQKAEEIRGKFDLTIDGVELQDDNEFFQYLQLARNKSNRMQPISDDGSSTIQDITSKSKQADEAGPSRLSKESRKSKEKIENSKNVNITTILQKSMTEDYIAPKNRRHSIAVTRKRIKTSNDAFHGAAEKSIEKIRKKSKLVPQKSQDDSDDGLDKKVTDRFRKKEDGLQRRATTSQEDCALDREDQGKPERRLIAHKISPVEDHQLVRCQNIEVDACQKPVPKLRSHDKSILPTPLEQENIPVQNNFVVKKYRNRVVKKIDPQIFKAALSKSKSALSKSI